MDGPVPGRPASPSRPWSRCRICRGRQSRAGLRRRSSNRPESAGAEPVSAALRKPGMTPSIKGPRDLCGPASWAGLIRWSEKRKRLRQTCGQQRLPAGKKPSIFHASKGLREAVKDLQGITMCKLHSNHLCCVHTDYLVSIKFYLENVKKDN